MGAIQLDKLTPADVRALVAAKVREGLAPATVRHVHGLLRNALGDAERLDLIGRNVAKAVRGPSVPYVEARGLTTEEARRLLEVIRDDRLYPLFLVLLTVGLRRGEGLGLAWADVDFDAGTLRVRQTLPRVDGSLQLVQPKTTRSARTVPVPRSTLDVLAEHRRRQTIERSQASMLGRRWPAPELVFVSTTGIPLEPRNVNRRWHELRQLAGLSWLRLHDLRHACASILLAQGVPARVVMELLGHSTIQLTLNTYMHVMPLVQREAANAMELALFDREARCSCRLGYRCPCAGANQFRSGIEKAQVRTGGPPGDRTRNPRI